MKNINPSGLAWQNLNFEPAENYKTDSRILVWQWKESGASVFVLKPGGLWSWTFEDESLREDSLVITNYDNKYWWAWLIKENI